MISGQTREQIYTRLFNTLKSAYDFKTVDRRALDLNQVPMEKRPWLGQIEHTDHYEQDATGHPPVVILKVTLLVYIDSSGHESQSTAPITYINNIVDAIDRVLGVDAYGVQTLGKDGNGNPFVNRCWIKGDVIKRGGEADGNGFAIVPVEIIVPS